MVGQAEVEIARKLFEEGWSGGHVDAPLQFMTEDVVMRDIVGHSEAMRGHDAVREFWAAAADTLKVLPEEIYVADSGVVVMWMAYGQIPTGRRGERGPLGNRRGRVPPRVPRRQGLPRGRLLARRPGRLRRLEGPLGGAPRPALARARRHHGRLARHPSRYWDSEPSSSAGVGGCGTSITLLRTKMPCGASATNRILRLDRVAVHVPEAQLDAAVSQPPGPDHADRLPGHLDLAGYVPLPRGCIDGKQP